jgi:hypothetical protein
MSALRVRYIVVYAISQCALTLYICLYQYTIMCYRILVLLRE